MAVRSTRLGVASAAGGGGGVTATVFTVPANRTYIIKSVRWAWTAGTAFPAVLKLDVLLSGVTSRQIAWASSGAVGTFESEGLFIVCLETDVLRLSVPANTTGQVYVSGASLDGDPS